MFNSTKKAKFLASVLGIAMMATTSIGFANPSECMDCAEAYGEGVDSTVSTKTSTSVSSKNSASASGYGSGFCVNYGTKELPDGTFVTSGECWGESSGDTKIRELEDNLMEEVGYYPPNPSKYAKGIPDGSLRAYTFPTNYLLSVGGKIRKGDFVDIVVTPTRKDSLTQDNRSYTIFEGVQVYDTIGKGKNIKGLTLLLDSKGIELLKFASTEGEVSFSLNPAHPHSSGMHNSISKKIRHDFDEVIYSLASNREESQTSGNSEENSFCVNYETKELPDGTFVTSGECWGESSGSGEEDTSQPPSEDVKKHI